MLRELADAGIRPDLVVGTSIGALVGAALATERLDDLEDWIRSLTQVEMVKLLDAGLSDGGFIGGTKLMRAFGKRVGDLDIEDCTIPFAAVATDVGNGREVWLQEGPIVDAVRASIAIPGLLSPVRHRDRWLVDGGLVNPVPVSVARALGADIVIAVNLNGDLVRSNGRSEGDAAPDEDATTHSHTWARRVGDWLKDRLPARFNAKRLFAREHGAEPPGMLAVIADSIDIMQDRITRARLAGEPPDALVSPRLGHIGILEFDRAGECIDEGRRCAAQELDDIKRLVGT